MAEERVERRLAAIFAADMVGYSRLMEADEEGTIARQKAHRGELIDPKIAENHGRIVKTTGDGMLVEFASVVDAVRCAVDVQGAMAEREAEVPYDRRIRYRVGINLGDIVVEGEDVMGDGVNVAARLEALAEPGGVFISGTAFDQLKQKLNVGYRFHGERTVKNIAEPIRVYEVIPDSEAGTVLSPRRMPTNSRYWIGGALALLLVIGGIGWWQPWISPIGPAQETKANLPLPKSPSIAVLPFANMSGDRKQQYFADGIAEDLITDLSKITGLFVIARNSSFAYRGTSVDVRKIGRELGVRYVIEGSVRKVGGRVRINAQLIDTINGRHLWAERYDGEMTDVFALQDRVTKQIVKALAVHLKSDEVVRVLGRETQNATAYDSFLKAWSHYQRRSAEDLRKADALFARAVELDPDFARAHAGLALTRWRASKFFWSATDVQRLSITKHLQLALRRPTAPAYYLASWMALERGRHGEAITQAKRAVEIEPNNPESHVAMANALVFSGDPKGAIPFIRKAMRLDPHFPADYLRVLGLAEFGMGRMDEAAALFKRALERNPKDQIPALALASAYGHLNRKQEAKQALAAYMKQFPDWNPTTNPVSIMANWHFREPIDTERFGVGLLKAGLCCRRDLDSLIASRRARKLRSKE